MYLGMEEWFHDINDKEEMINARPIIATVLTFLKIMIIQMDTSCLKCMVQQKCKHI